MFKTQNKEKWINPQKNLYAIGGFFSAIMTALLLSFILNRVYPLLVLGGIFLINLIIWAAVLHEYDRLANTVVKRFLMDVPTAAQIVKNVLGEKSLPFEVFRQVEFWIDTGGAPTRVKINRQQFYVSIAISSKSAENIPLIESLCAKLDEAFTPRGLR